MVSRFKGRDYSTLREEIIEFLRQKLPQEWDSTNLSDPIVIFAESLAQMGDQLHYTIDELRRECDMATARRSSSVYSYAMREGYKMMLPKGSSGMISINSSPDQSNRLHLSLKQFDEIKVQSTGDSLFVANSNPIEADLQKIPDSSYLEEIGDYPTDDSPESIKKRNSYIEYANNMYRQTQHVSVVLGTKGEFNFNYGDINSDSTVDLIDPLIDRNLIRLTVTDPADTSTEWRYISDIIGSGFVGNIYTITPKFIGGAVTLSIEFPTNYRDLFSQSAKFKFEYIKIKDSKIESTDYNNGSIDLSKYIKVKDEYKHDQDILQDGIKYIVNLNSGIKGYTEYEDPIITRENYKKFVQDYSSLLTKDDYANYIKTITATFCKAYDHSDMYRENILPPGTSLIPRVLYILTEAKYDERETLWLDLKERSSRSDCIMMMPYGKDPYTIVVKAECFLLGTSITDVATKVKAALMQYYSGNVGEKVPEESMICYLCHRASDKVARVSAVTVSDSEYGLMNTDFNDVSTLSSNDVDSLYNAILSGDTNSEMGQRYLLKQYDETPYNKYPVKIYKQFPDEFPKIYYKNSNMPINDYDELVKYQAVYGVLDSPLWDYEDSDIFNEAPEQVSEGVFVRNIKSDYIKHHYMTPVLNRVVVLIKAVSSN